MPITYTPLRYPGGKSKLYKYILEILNHNRLNDCIYVEPFVGGAGLALSLLFRGNVRRIIINDYDYSIYTFWYCVINQTDLLIKAIENTAVTVDEWYKQQEIQREPQKHDIFDVAFSTFFLNRVNRSGIIKGGVIGGINQKGKYKIDCRFNKSNLIYKIKKISAYKEKITLYNLDAKKLINSVLDSLPDDSFIYFDPPYIKQGNNLYCNYYTKEDHIMLSHSIKGLDSHWVLTYDDDPLVYEMYEGYYKKKIYLTYSTGTKKMGTELMIFSNKTSHI